MQEEVLSQLNPVYYKGDLTLCDSWWHFEKILVRYDRIYFIVEGECVIEVNGVRHIAKPGQLFYLPSGSRQTLFTQPVKTVKKYWLHCKLACEGRELSDLIALPYYIDVEEREMVEELFLRILARDQALSLSDKLEQKADILYLMSYYIRAAHSTQLSADHDSRIAYIISYIEKNLQRHITLAELSQILHFHPSYFIRYFKAATGLTPTAFINDRRITLAQRLLLDETLSVQEVAAGAGFQSLHYFSRCFQRRTGMNPSKYRDIAIHRHRAK